MNSGCSEVAKRGNAIRDWPDAEEIVMEEIHEARE